MYGTILGLQTVRLSDRLGWLTMDWLTEEVVVLGEDGFAVARRSHENREVFCSPAAARLWDG